jgi:hypothetical protein
VAVLASIVDVRFFCRQTQKISPYFDAQQCTDYHGSQPKGMQVQMGRTRAGHGTASHPNVMHLLNSGDWAHRRGDSVGFLCLLFIL